MTKEEQLAHQYAVKRRKDPYYPVYNWERDEIEDAYIEGFQQGRNDAIEKVCKLIFEYNQNQAKRFGARSEMRINDFTINVEDFRKKMEEQI